MTAPIIILAVFMGFVLIAVALFVNCALGIGRCFDDEARHG